MKLGYYPGCSGEGSAIEYHLSTLKTAEMLGVELVELDDWNCCGATSAHNTNKLLSLALPARNLAIAEKSGLGDILTPCAACYSRHKGTEIAARHDDSVRKQIEEVIDMEFKASSTTISILEFLTQKVGIDKIKTKVTQPLKGMKAACYYGCLLVRPVEYTGFDDPEDPQTMDQIVQALGAQALDWAYKTECCGASLATSRPDIGSKMIYEVLKNAKEAGAECIVTACPLCMMNLDMRQASAEKASGEKFGIPIYYITELVAIAGGTAPKEVGIDRHFVEALTYLKTLPAKALQMEAEAEKAKPQAEEKPELDEEALKKKVAAFVKGFEKNPEKMAARFIDNEERAGILVEIVSADEKKMARLAELMVTDKDKAVKAAEAFVTGEIKKREKAKA